MEGKHRYSREERWRPKEEKKGVAPYLTVSANDLQSGERAWIGEVCAV